jgi:hypothetical protein
MKLTITHTGLFRYSEDSINSFQKNILSPLRRQGFEVDVFSVFWKVKLTDKDKFDLVKYRKKIENVASLNIKWVNPSILHGDHPFSKVVHEDRFAYYRVFKLLQISYDLIASSDKIPDIIIRSRPDLVFMNELVIQNFNCSKNIFIPPIEGHEEIPYNPIYCCNDQFAMGTFFHMADYFRLCNMSSEQVASCEKIGRNGYSHGIEGILLGYLQRSKYKIKNINLLYFIHGKEYQPFKAAINKYCPNIIWSYGPYRLTSIFFRYLRNIWLRFYVPK